MPISDRQLRQDYNLSASESWRVHSDALQARGDPRGQLIALELHRNLEPEGPTRERLDRAIAELYAEHEQTWLGPDIQALVEDWRVRVRTQWEWRFGYLHSVSLTFEGWDPSAMLQTVLASDAASFVQHVELSGSPTRLATTLEALSSRSQTFRSLDLRFIGGPLREGFYAQTSLGAAVIAATPHLSELQLLGRTLIESFPHPNLRRLGLTGHDGIVQLGPDTALPQLRHLELTLMCGYQERERDGGPSEQRMQTLIGGTWTPRLRSLDLSRNNPGFEVASEHLGGWRSARFFELAVQSPMLPQLDELRLPSPPRGTNPIKTMIESPTLSQVGSIEIPRVYELISHGSLAEPFPQLEIGVHFPHRAWPDFLHSEMTLGRVTFKFDWLLSSIQRFYLELSDQTRATLDALVAAFTRLSPGQESRLGPELQLRALQIAAAELAELEGSQHGMSAQLAKLLTNHHEDVTPMHIQRGYR